MEFFSAPVDVTSDPPFFYSGPYPAKVDWQVPNPPWWLHGGEPPGLLYCHCGCWWNFYSSLPKTFYSHLCRFWGKWYSGIFSGTELTPTVARKVDGYLRIYSHFKGFKCLLLWRVCPDWFHWWGKTCTHWKKGEFYWLSVPSQAINIVLCFLSPGFFLYLLTKLCFECGAFWTSEPIHGLLANSIFCTVADHTYTNDALKMANDWNVCISTVNVLHVIYK